MCFALKKIGNSCPESLLLSHIWSMGQRLAPLVIPSPCSKALGDVHVQHPLCGAGSLASVASCCVFSLEQPLLGFPAPLVTLVLASQIFQCYSSGFLCVYACTCMYACTCVPTGWAPWGQEQYWTPGSLNSILELWTHLNRCPDGRGPDSRFNPWYQVELVCRH